MSEQTTHAVVFKHLYAAVWEPYSGELKVVEAVVSQDEPSPLPRLNPAS